MFEPILNIHKKYPAIFLVAILGILAFFGNAALQLQVDPNFDTLISQDGEYNANLRAVRNSFTQNDGLEILVKIDRDSILQNRPRTVKGEHMGNFYEELTTRLKESSYVVSVIGPIYSEDERYAKINVGLSRPYNLDAFQLVQNEIEAITKEIGTPPGTEIQLTGLPLLLDKISRLLIGDSLRTILITFLLVVIILSIYFREVRASLLTMAAPLISIILLAGTMALLNIHVTLTLAAVGVLMLGLGVDYSIHIIIHYQDHRHQGARHREALKLTFEELRVPITASFLTTLAGFSALILGASPSSQAQGLVLSIAIAIIYLVSILIVPFLLRTFGKDLHFRENQTFKELTKIMTKLAVYQAKHPKTVLTIIGIITIIMFIGLTQVKFSTSNSNWIPDDDPVSLSLKESEWAYGTEDRVNVLIKATNDDLRNTQTVRDAQRLSAQLKNIPSVDEINSPFDNLSLKKADIIDTLSNERSNSFNRDYTLALIQIKSRDFGVDEAGDSLVLEEVRTILATQPIHNAETSMFGDVVRFDELGDSLEQDAAQTTMIGLVLVFIAVALIYFSITVGLTSLIPIVVAVVWAIGLMGYLNVPFTSLSTGIVSLVLGIGADFSIHIVDGIKRYMNKGKTIQQAIERTLGSSGSAILLSSTTTLFGFLGLILAVLLGTQRLGLSLAFSIVAVFLVTISMAPAIMSIYYKRKNKRGKKK